MASADSIVRMANDCIDVLEAVKRRAVVAEYQAKGANRQANKLGTNITGGRGEGPQYSNPTADEAFRAIDTLEKTQSSMGAIKEYLYQMAGVLAEFAPDRSGNSGARRCGEDDCAKEHKALGLCEAHYRAFLRKESRQKAIDAQRAADDAA